jgi:microcystin degradation protein MlrC
MRRLERDPRVISASLFMVHPFTSAENLGWAVHVCTDDDPELAATLVEQLADRAWATRRAPLPPTRTIDEALDEVRESPWRRTGPLSLIDMDDVVGAGAPGGNTRLLQALARDDRGLRTLIPVHDPAAVDAAWAVADGTETTLLLTGTPGYDQPSVSLTGRVVCRHTSDFGRIVRFDCGPVHVAITEQPPLPIHPKFWRELGVNPRQADAIVQKNFFHYRIFYATTSFRHLPVVSAGATSFDRLRERQWPVPSYPSGDPQDWRTGDPLLRGLGRRA